jgi:hypothetical protein
MSSNGAAFMPGRTVICFSDKFEAGDRNGRLVILFPAYRPSSDTLISQLL